MMSEDQQSTTEPLLNSKTSQPQQDGGGEHVADSQIIYSSAIPTSEEEEKKCRDTPFAILFLLHVFIVLIMALAYGAPAAARDVSENENDDTDLNDEYQGFVKILLSCTCLAYVTSFLTLSCMILFPEKVIQLSLRFTILISFVLAIVCICVKYYLSGVISLLICLPTAVYTHFVWKRIPYSSCTLSVGLRAVKANGGLLLIVYGIVFLTMVYLVLWILAMIGIYDVSAECGEHECESSPSKTALAFGFLAALWTEQVCQNIIHVTVSGTLGTWWFYPDLARSFCSKPLRLAFKRATVQSLGSICFGSILVFTTECLNHLTLLAREHDEGVNVLYSICKCFGSLSDTLYKYFNKWAFVYVGVYALPYGKAANKAVSLFEEKGWHDLVTDDLITNSLTLIIGMNGFAIGVIGLAMTHHDSWFSDNDNVRVTGTSIAFFIGVIVSWIMLSIVDAAVNTIIVLFAEAPSEFAAAHPLQCEELKKHWKVGYPNVFGDLILQENTDENETATSVDNDESIQNSNTEDSHHENQII